MSPIAPHIAFLKLVESTAQDEDLRRQEFITNVLLLGSVLLSLAATVDILGEYFFLPHGLTANIVSPYLMLGILGYFTTLYLLSRRGYHQVASYGLLAVYYLVSVYTMYAWGFQVAQAWLTMALLIVTSGFVLTMRSAIGIATLSALTMIVMGQLEMHGITHPNRYWIAGTGSSEIVSSVATFCILTLVAWMADRDIHRTLQRARSSERELKQERDLLETRVQERTKELRLSQQEEASRLFRFAQFGRLTSGILHDLLNPLAAVSLNLEELSQLKGGAPLKEAIENIHRMERFIEATRKEIQNQEDLVDFSVAHEVREATQVLRYRANQAHTKVTVDIDRDIKLHASPVKFHQVISNLLSNAIDACSALPAGEERRDVAVTMESGKEALLLTVTDTGIGISEENQKHIFEPLFTTKDIDHGTGLGLSVCKEIVEQDFQGSISMRSKEGAGSSFTVRIPLPS